MKGILEMNGTERYLIDMNITIWLKTKDKKQDIWQMDNLIS